MMRDYVAVAEHYVSEVLAGRVVANRLTRLACERHVRDRAREAAGGPIVMHAPDALRVCAFIEQFHHVKGVWAKRREKLRLEPFQCFIVVSIFGWKWRETGLRRFSHAYLEMQRKNAKSTLVAPIGLYMLTCDGEEGPEVYSAATKKDQAKIVLNAARAMARRCPEFMRRRQVKVLEHRITAGESGEAEFRPLEAQKLDGLNPNCSIVDELHEHPDSRVFDALDQAMGSRDEPLMLMITTAGDDIAGVCYDQHDYVERILDQVIEDDSYFGLIYAIDPGDDPFDEAVWPKANPNLGVSKSIQYMRNQASKAKASPQRLGAFLRKHLGVWTSTGVTAFDMDGWRLGERPGLDRDDYAGAGGTLGFDLAIVKDLCSIAATIWDDDELIVFARHHVTEAVAKAEGNEHIWAWCEQGLITRHPGHMIDLNVVETDVREMADHFGSLEVAYDPQFAAAMAASMANDGYTMVEFRPSPMNMHQPFETAQGLVREGRLVTDGDPVLRWNAANTIIEKRGEFERPAKRRPAAKIDGVSAVLTGLGRLEAPTEPKTVIEVPSGYSISL